MARKAKKAAQSGKKSSRQRSGSHRWYRTLLGLVVATAGFVFGAYFVGNRVASYPEFNLKIEKVELDAAGRAWLPEEVRDEIEAIPRSLSNLNLLSEGVLADVRQRLAANPWVREVCYVEKVFPDRIKFSLAIRRPVAWIAHKSGLYLADFEGTRLPVDRKEKLTTRHLPVIDGLSARTPLPSPGEKWRSERVSEGICIAGYLLGDLDLLMGEAGRIRSIDVSGVGRRGRGIVLVTDDARRIEWGRTELSGKVRLISDEEKLANLRLILRGEASLDDRSYYLLWTTPTAGPREQHSYRRER